MRANLPAGLGIRSSTASGPLSNLNHAQKSRTRPQLFPGRGHRRKPSRRKTFLQRSRSQRPSLFTPRGPSSTASQLKSFKEVKFSIPVSDSPVPCLNSAVTLGPRTNSPLRGSAGAVGEASRYAHWPWVVENSSGSNPGPIIWPPRVHPPLRVTSVLYFEEVERHGSILRPLGAGCLHL